MGIDVSKDSLEVALADKAASVRFNDEQGVKALLEHLAGHNVAVVLLEATGGLEKRCAHALYLAGMTVVVANPGRRMNSPNRWGTWPKTDGIDARILSHFARTCTATRGLTWLLFRNRLRRNRSNCKRWSPGDRSWCKCAWRATAWPGPRAVGQEHPGSHQATGQADQDA
ncbi:MAG: transposase [Paenacidovorax caeni]